MSRFTSYFSFVNLNNCYSVSVFILPFLTVHRMCIFPMAVSKHLRKMLSSCMPSNKLFSTLAKCMEAPPSRPDIGGKMVH